MVIENTQYYYHWNGARKQKKLFSFDTIDTFLSILYLCPYSISHKNLKLLKLTFQIFYQ